MASEQKPEKDVNDAFTFKKFMGNVASTAKLFTATDTNHNGAPKPTKTMKELQQEIEILHLQKEDLRSLVQERTYQLDQLKKLDTEHQNVRTRWKQNQEKAANDVANISAYSDELKKELNELKAQNAVLQSKQTNNDLIKNKLENKLREKMEEEHKTKKIIDRKTQEKKMLVSEVLKLRNDKQELIHLYQKEIDKLNKNNRQNIEQLTQLNEQQIKGKEMEYTAEINALNHKYNELQLLYTNYKQNITDKIVNIDSTTNAFEVMINNANIGNLTQCECNKILDNIINSIETMEKENEKQNDTKSNEKEKEEEALLNKIESRMLKSLREKGVLQRSTNGLMFQLQELQKQHEEQLKAKNHIIQQHEIRAKVTFFKKKQSK